MALLGVGTLCYRLPYLRLLSSNDESIVDLRYFKIQLFSSPSKICRPCQVLVARKLGLMAAFTFFGQE
eukprot:SAG11_NODE_3070_length_2714_cov_1.624092_1_plen_67_part_10